MAYLMTDGLSTVIPKVTIAFEHEPNDIGQDDWKLSVTSIAIDNIREDGTPAIKDTQTWKGSGRDESTCIGQVIQHITADMKNRIAAAKMTVTVWEGALKIVETLESNPGASDLTALWRTTDEPPAPAEDKMAAFKAASEEQNTSARVVRAVSAPLGAPRPERSEQETPAPEASPEERILAEALDATRDQIGADVEGALRAIETGEEKALQQAEETFAFMAAENPAPSEPDLTNLWRTTDPSRAEVAARDAAGEAAQKRVRDNYGDV